MSNNKLAYWEARGHLSSSFCRPDHLATLWAKLKKNRVVQDDDGGSSLLQESRLSNMAIGWSNISPQELCEYLQDEHRLRSYFLTSTSFSTRAKQRLTLLELFYADIARYTRAVVGKASEDEEDSITPTLDTVLQGNGECEQPQASGSPEEKFMHFATRSAITIMFAFLKQAGRSSDPELVQTLLDDASGLIGELPLACLRKLYHGSLEASPDNWLFAFQHAMRFLEDVCKSSSFPTRTREVALVLRAHLAGTTGSLRMMLDAVLHMVQASDLDTSILSDLTARFADLHVLSKAAEGTASEDAAPHLVAPGPAYLAGPGKHPQPGTPFGKYQIPAMLLSHLARLSPPVRTVHDDVQVYGWGEEPNYELGFQRGRSLSTPSLCSSLSHLKPLHITLASKTTFLIDSEGKLWSCGQPTSRLLGHEGHSLKLVAGLENERFVQVAGIDHVLALTTRGEVYSWGSNSYSQLGRADDPHTPTKITRGFTRAQIVYVAVGSQHSAAVSEAGVLYTWGRGSYGRLGHGTSDDVPFPQPVAALESKHIKIATVACGLGDAHTLALSRDGIIYAFGDGDYGKLGLGTTDRTRVPVPVQCDFDGTKVKQVWCGRQISACLTEGGALYTWGNSSGGALGNGESYGTVTRPQRILADTTIKSAYIGFQRGLALTHEGEVYIWGVLGSPSSVSIPHPLPDLSGKNITHVTGGPNHIVLWSGDPKSVSNNMSPFSPSASQTLLETFARLLEQFFSLDLTNDVHATAAAVATCSLLERTFQLASRARLGDIAALRSRIRQPLLDFAVGSRPCPEQLRIAARFCLLQGWEALDIPDKDRQQLLEAITAIVFQSCDPPPTPEEEQAARQMLQTRWRFLLPMQERLRWLSNLLPQTLASTAPSNEEQAPPTQVASESGGRSEDGEGSGHRFMVSVIVNSLFQQGVVEQAVRSFFSSGTQQQELFLQQAEALLSSPMPSPVHTPYAAASTRSSGFDIGPNEATTPPGPGLASTPASVSTATADSPVVGAAAQGPANEALSEDLRSMLFLLSIFVTTMTTRAQQVITSFRSRHNDSLEPEEGDILSRLCYRFLRSFFAQVLFGGTAPPPSMPGTHHASVADEAERQSQQEGEETEVEERQQRRRRRQRQQQQRRRVTPLSRISARCQRETQRLQRTEESREEDDDDDEEEEEEDDDDDEDVDVLPELPQPPSNSDVRRRRHVRHAAAKSGRRNPAGDAATGNSGARNAQQQRGAGEDDDEEQDEEEEEQEREQEQEEGVVERHGVDMDEQTRSTDHSTLSVSGVFQDDGSSDEEDAFGSRDADDAAPFSRAQVLGVRLLVFAFELQYRVVDECVARDVDAPQVLAACRALPVAIMGELLVMLRSAAKQRDALVSCFVEDALSSACQLLTALNQLQDALPFTAEAVQAQFGFEVKGMQDIGRSPALPAHTVLDLSQQLANTITACLVADCASEAMRLDVVAPTIEDGILENAAFSAGLARGTKLEDAYWRRILEAQGMGPSAKTQRGHQAMRRYSSAPITVSTHGQEQGLGSLAGRGGGRADDGQGDAEPDTPSPSQSPLPNTTGPSPAPDAGEPLVDVMREYAEAHNIGLRLPQQHLVWRISAATFTVLARHLGLMHHLHAHLNTRDIEANPLLAEVVKVSVLMQPHVMRLKQELRLSDDDLQARTRAICLFLLTQVQPTSRSMAGSGAAAEPEGGWQQSRARVSVTDAPLLDPEALSGRVNLDTSPGFDDLDEQGRQAVEDLQSGLDGNDPETLAQSAPSHPWFMAQSPQQTSLRALPKEIAELVVSFLRQPFPLRQVRAQLVSRSALAQSRIKVLKNLCNMVDMPLTQPVRYQLLCGLLDPRANPYPFVPLGRFLDGISCASSAEKRELTELHSRVLQHILGLLEVACEQLLSDLHGSGEASTVPLRMLHLCQNLLIQSHEPPALEKILTSNAFHALAQVCFSTPPPLEAELRQQQEQRAEEQRDRGTGEQTSASVSSAGRDSTSSDGGGVVGAGGDDGSGTDGTSEDGLSYFDGIETIKVSSNSRNAGALRDPSPTSLWESNGRRGAHWVLVKTRPGTVVHRLSITPASADSFAPRQVVVRAGSDPADLKEVRRINCSQALDPNEDIVILDRARQHYPYIRLDVSSWGINVRLRRVTVQSIDLATLRAHIAGKPRNRRVGRRLFKYLALSASCCVDQLSDTALGELVSQCRVALLQGSDDHKASMLAVYRRMASSTRLQVRFCATPWLDILLDLFRDAATTVRIFVLRFMVAALPGLASASNKSVDVRMLIEQLMRGVSDFTDMSGTPENQAVLVELVHLMRTLHSLPGWRDALNEVIVQDLCSLPDQRRRLQEGTYVREEVRGVLGTLTLVGLEAPRFRIGATCEHALRGTGTITQLTDASLHVEFHSPDDKEGPLVLTLTDAEKELTVETLKPFDFLAACSTGLDRMAFRTLLFESFTSWPDHILSQKMQFEMLQACKLFFRTPVAFDLFLEEQRSPTRQPAAPRPADAAAAVAEPGPGAAQHKSRRKRKRKRKRRQHTSHNTRSRNTSERAAQFRPQAQDLDVVAEQDGERPGEDVLREGSTGAVAREMPAERTSGNPSESRSRSRSRSRSSSASSTSRVHTAARLGVSASASDTETDTDTETETGSSGSSESESESESELEGVPGPGGMGRRGPHRAPGLGGERPAQQDAGDKRPVDTKFIETVLNWSVVPSPVRAEYDLHSVANVCSEVIQSFLAHTPLSKPGIDIGACVENGYEEVTASSNMAHIKGLLEKTHNTYWQSATRQSSPWLRVFMKPNQFVSALKLHVDPNDASFMPKEVEVLVGQEVNDLQTMCTVSVPRQATAVTLLEAAAEHYRVIQLNVLQTHNGGVDCRVRRLEILSRPMRHITDATSLDDLLAPTPEVALCMRRKSVADSRRSSGAEDGAGADAMGRGGSGASGDGRRSDAQGAGGSASMGAGTSARVGGGGGGVGSNSLAEGSSSVRPRRGRHVRHDSREVDELLETLMEHHHSDADTRGGGLADSDSNSAGVTRSSSNNSSSRQRAMTQEAAHPAGNDEEEEGDSEADDLLNDLLGRERGEIQQHQHQHQQLRQRGQHLQSTQPQQEEKNDDEQAHGGRARGRPRRGHRSSNAAAGTSERSLLASQSPSLAQVPERSSTGQSPVMGRGSGSTPPPGPDMSIDEYPQRQRHRRRRNRGGEGSRHSRESGLPDQTEAVDPAAEGERRHSDMSRANETASTRSSTRGSSTSVRTRPGTAAPVAYAWGCNKAGQLDSLFPSAQDMSQTPKPKACSLLPPGLRLTKMCVQKEGVVVLSSDGGLYSSAHPGPLERLLPRGPKIIDVAYGGHHILAVTQDNRVLVSGTGKSGKLGLRDERDCAELTTVPSLRDVVRVACGRRHSAAVTANGQLYTWGCNHHGRLGLGDQNDRYEPTLVDRLPPVHSVACGDRHTLVLTKAGGVYAFGCGDQGRLGVLGVGHRVLRPEPVYFGSNVRITRVVCGSSSSGALSESGQLFVWGTGRNYRLGTGTSTAHLRPTCVSDLTPHKVVDASLGHEHGVAVTENGDVYVWGSNDSSQLGGATASQMAMRPVVHPDLRGKGLNRVSCSSRTVVVWRDSTLADVDDDEGGVARAGLEPLPVQEDRLGRHSVDPHDDIDVERLVEQVSTSPPLLSVVAHLPDPEAQQKSVAYLLKAMRVYQARQLVTLWLSRGVDALEGVPWGADRVLLVLVDLMRLLSVRAAAAEACRVIGAAIHTLCGRHRHLSRVLVEICVMETQRALPHTEPLDGGMLTDEFILTSLCSLGLIRAAIDCTIDYSSGLSMLRLAHALASLWTSNQAHSVRQWVLARLNTLLHNGSRDFLSELRRLVHFMESGTGGGHQEDATNEGIEQARALQVGSDTESDVGGERPHDRGMHVQQRHPDRHVGAVRGAEGGEAGAEGHRSASGAVRTAAASVHRQRGGGMRGDAAGGHAADQHAALLGIGESARGTHASELRRSRRPRSGEHMHDDDGDGDEDEDDDDVGEHENGRNDAADADQRSSRRARGTEGGGGGGGVVGVGDDDEGDDDDDDDDEDDDDGADGMSGIHSAHSSNGSSSHLGLGSRASEDPGASAALFGHGSGQDSNRHFFQRRRPYDQQQQRHHQHQHRQRQRSDGLGATGRRTSHTGRVLSLEEFASFNVSGSGTLNLCELHLLLLHRDVDSCYFQLAHTFAQLGVPLSRRFDYQATHRFLLRTHLDKTPHKSLFGTGDDEAALQASVGAVLRRFAQSLWACLKQQHEYETTLEKDGRILMRSEFNRVMCRVAAGLDLPPSSKEKPSWFHAYCTTSREFNRLTDRRAFSDEFARRIMSALEGRGDEGEDPQVRDSLDYLDNQLFTAQMDKAILHWKAREPEELRLAYTKDAVPTVNFPRLTFRPLSEGQVKTSNNNSTVHMQSEATEENTWVLAETVLTSGMHYWTIRCDAKGSTRRYVGVGVGKPNSAYPLGAARILSEGVLKSGTSAIPIPQGFGPNDIVGVFLDLNRNMVSFDVNGQKRGEIELPGLAPGEGVQPLVYLFYPGDKMSFVYGLPLPSCYRLGNDTRSYFSVIGRRSLVLRAAPSMDSGRVGVLAAGHRAETVVMAIDYRSNREGVWLRLANPDNVWGDAQCWCLLREPSGTDNLEPVETSRDAAHTAINYTDNLPTDTAVGTPEMAAGKRMAQCITPASMHNVRAGTSLDAMAIGGVSPSMMVYYTDVVQSEDGEWLVLDAESKERVVEPNMKHLDAYVLFKGSDGVVYFKLEEPPPVITEPPPAYPVLQGVPIGQIKRRCFLLETLSSSVLSLASLIEFQSMETNGGVSLGLGGTQKALQALQDLLLLTHKERLIKAVIARTMVSTAPRITITLNRVQIHRQPTGVAGIYGQNSVFAQACRELRKVDNSVFLVPSRCWKVKFAGEGVDDAGGGYSESISEMCEELVNGSLTLLIPTPNKVQDSGDSRDVYLFNPSATSPAELELFEFLGVLIGIAIRTNNPISLPLAGPVWKQLTGLALTIADLREVDTDYVTTLEIIKSLSEEAFSSYDIGGDTPSAKEGLTYQVMDVPRLTPATRDEYVRKALHYRLHEFDAQVRAVRHGMARVVPLPLLSMLQPNELQAFVLGKQDIDLSLLQAMTRYKGMKRDSSLVTWFWDAMRELSPVELSLFLRFVSGRTRLPRTQADFEGKHFVLQALDRYEDGSTQADSALPEALTCFFTLKIPKYSSFQVLLQKLRYAINHCKAIDTDNYARTTLPAAT